MSIFKKLFEKFSNKTENISTKFINRHFQCGEYFKNKTKENEKQKKLNESSSKVKNLDLHFIKAHLNKIYKEIEKESDKCEYNIQYTFLHNDRGSKCDRKCIVDFLEKVQQFVVLSPYDDYSILIIKWNNPFIKDEIDEFELEYPGICKKLL